MPGSGGLRRLTKEGLLRLARSIFLVAAGAGLSACGGVAFETPRACQDEANAHLRSLNLPKTEIVDTTLRPDEVGGRSSSRATGHSLWVSLKSCSGHLVLEMGRACELRRTYLTGDCADRQGL